MKHPLLLLLVLTALRAPTAQASPITLNAEQLDDAFAGEGGGDYLRWAHTPGDINGDDVDDLIVCADGSDRTYTEAGSCYFYFGPVAGGGKYPSVKNADFILSGELASSYLGYGTVTGQADFNGDGIDDVVLGSFGYNGNKGRVYLLFGREDWTGVTLDEADVVLDGEKGNDRFGYFGSSLCDLDADGFTDLVVTADAYDGNTIDQGRVYIFHGGAGGFVGRTLSTADATLTGSASGDTFGFTTSCGGDLNGDGYDDLAVGADTADANGGDSGRLYLYFGRPAGFSGTLLASSANVTLNGEASLNYLTTRTSSQDLNGDGLADLVASAYGYDSNRGKAYVVLGRTSGWQTSASIAVVADASFLGEQPQSEVFHASAADVTGDGLADLLLGSAVEDTRSPDAGAVYLIKGRRTGWAKDQSIAQASDLLIRGLSGNHKLFGYLNPGTHADMDDDGFPDFTIGHIYADLNGLTDNGAMWLLTDVNQYFDDDGDGFSEFQGDCNDAIFSIRPGAREVCDDTIDQDCDGVDLPCLHDDLDGDGYTPAGGDCDDTRADINPAAPEIFDGVDNNCNGDIDEGLPQTDNDGDKVSESSGDCNDNPDDPAAAFMFPGNPEVPDLLDNNCNGVIDEGTVYFDDDGDSFDELEGDCDDSDPSRHPTASEGTTCDFKDQNCNGQTDEGTLCHDDDGDGFSEDGSLGGQGDCNDAHARIYPGALEYANGLDDDCDGAIDEGMNTFDDDGDGFSEAQGDCDDDDTSTYPNAPELGDGKDNDCDGKIDEDTDLVDDDGDGFSELDLDCNDATPAIYPGAVEVLNGIDDNCDGIIDNHTQYYDDDGDGFTELDSDCDDARANVHPGAPEGPDSNDDGILEGDGLDNDCDGVIDEGTDLADDDDDGFTELEGDCDDSTATFAPNALEIPYDGLDQDCDGSDLEDVDGDGFASSQVGGQDCDDASAAIFPNATEYCGDGIDQNCDTVDAVCVPEDGAGLTVDADGDGYGESVDCDDGNASIHPTAGEISDAGIDNDCDGEVDESDSAGCSCTPTPPSSSAPAGAAGGLLLWGFLGWRLRRRG